ncbi:MAG: LysM peptidoglycan-binding domain-containing protein [Anaerolineaceae bacterium]|nr:MAG: LysM peptidoglycan-binding domain-containing protein [Anaerolineaceae bacterium]
MSDQPEPSPKPEASTDTYRCPDCDSVVQQGSEQCIMCGAILDMGQSHSKKPQEQAQEFAANVALLDANDNGAAEVFESVMKERKTRSLFWLVIIIAALTLIASILLLRTQDAEITLAMAPTVTAIPATETYTATWTPLATETSPPTESPTGTNTPAPTDTPRPPRFHNVASGETLFGLSLFYRISADSIAADNGIPINSPIQVGQQLLIPWPTATPPLESLLLEIKGENIIADATDCEIVTIAEGDSAYGLSAQHGVPAEAIVAVNRLTDETIQLLHPGDTLCIPKIIHSDALPPTPGPSPTITATSFPSGPELLYPINDTVVDQLDEIVAVQWVAVKDLREDEWYMVELTNLDTLDAIPQRAFTRDTAFRLPTSWRPEIPQSYRFRWRISIVHVTGQRADGEFIYKYGGRSSEDAYFSWLGAVPTATPTATPTPSETPLP